MFARSRDRGNTLYMERRHTTNCQACGATCDRIHPEAPACQAFEASEAFAAEVNELAAMLIARDFSPSEALDCALYEVGGSSPWCEPRVARLLGAA